MEEDNRFHTGRHRINTANTASIVPQSLLSIDRSYCRPYLTPRIVPPVQKGRTYLPRNLDPSDTQVGTWVPWYLIRDRLPSGVPPSGGCCKFAGVWQSPAKFSVDSSENDICINALIRFYIPDSKTTRALAATGYKLSYLCNECHSH